MEKSDGLGRFLLLFWGFASLLLCMWLTLGMAGDSNRDYFYPDSISDVKKFHDVLHDKVDKCLSDNLCSKGVLRTEVAVEGSSSSHSAPKAIENEASKFLKALATSKSLSKDLSSEDVDEAKKAAFEYTNNVARYKTTIDEVFSYFDEKSTVEIPEKRTVYKGDESPCKFFNNGYLRCHKVIFHLEQDKDSSGKIESGISKEINSNSQEKKKEENSSLEAKNGDDNAKNTSKD